MLGHKTVLVDSFFSLEKLSELYKFAGHLLPLLYQVVSIKAYINKVVLEQTEKPNIARQTFSIL